MFRGVCRIGSGQTGFTLVETLIGVAITGLIVVGLASGVTLLQNVSSRNVDSVVAVNESRNAAYWIRRDAKMAQTIQTDPGPSGLPLVFAWTEWDNTSNQVTYAIQDGGLTRSHSVDGEAPNTLILVQSVEPDAASTNCQYAGGVLDFEFVVTRGEGSRAATASNVLRVSPRSDQ